METGETRRGKLTSCRRVVAAPRVPWAHLLHPRGPHPQLLQELPTDGSQLHPSPESCPWSKGISSPGKAWEGTPHLPGGSPRDVWLTGIDKTSLHAKWGVLLNPHRMGMGLNQGLSLTVTYLLGSSLPCPADPPFSWEQSLNKIFAQKSSPPALLLQHLS